MLPSPASLPLDRRSLRLFLRRLARQPAPGRLVAALFLAALLLLGGLARHEPRVGEVHARPRQVGLAQHARPVLVRVRVRVRTLTLTLTLNRSLTLNLTLTLTLTLISGTRRPPSMAAVGQARPRRSKASLMRAHSSSCSISRTDGADMCRCSGADIGRPMLATPRAGAAPWDVVRVRVRVGVRARVRVSLTLTLTLILTLTFGRGGARPLGRSARQPRRRADGGEGRAAGLTHALRGPPGWSQG